MQGKHRILQLFIPIARLRNCNIIIDPTCKYCFLPFPERPLLPSRMVLLKRPGSRKLGRKHLLFKKIRRAGYCRSITIFQIFFHQKSARLGSQCIGNGSGIQRFPSRGLHYAVAYRRATTSRHYQSAFRHRQKKLSEVHSTSCSAADAWRPW